MSWSLALKGTIYHDIPFGVIQEREDRPFFPASWVDYSDGENGIAFFHQGTYNHWMQGRTLYNLLAWGEDTDAIHNGLGRYQWLKSFDQRVEGLHTIRLAVLPHAGDWRKAELPCAAQKFGMPPVVIQTKPHPGSLPASFSLLQLANSACVATATQVQADQLVCRLYSTSEASLAPKFSTRGIRAGGLRLLQGELVDDLSPYQIGECLFDKTHP